MGITETCREREERGVEQEGMNERGGDNESKRETGRRRSEGNTAE